jgi:hypothetical protein
MNVYVVTYNTKDKPERRMIWKVRKSKKKAESDRQEIIKTFGDFLADTEIDERPLD